MKRTRIIGAALACVAFASPAFGLTLHTHTPEGIESEYFDGIPPDFVEASGPGYSALADWNAGVFRAASDADGTSSHAYAEFDFLDLVYQGPGTVLPDGWFRASIAGTFTVPVPTGALGGNIASVAGVLSMAPPGSQTANVHATFSQTVVRDQLGNITVTPNSSTERGGQVFVSQSDSSGAVFDLWMPGLTLQNGDFLFVNGLLQTNVVSNGGTTVSDFANTMDLSLVLPEGFEGAFFYYGTGEPFDPSWSVPEPSSTCLLGLALGLAAAFRRVSAP
jgi:hypothetical protein